MGAGGDDGYFTSASGFDASGNAMIAGYISGAYDRIWVTFDGVAIPQGATINTASVTFKVYDIPVVGTIELYIRGNDIDDAVSPTNITEANALVLTSQNVEWDYVNSEDPFVEKELSTPDISTIIQAIVDREGWSSGNAMLIEVRPDTTNIGAGDALYMRTYDYGYASILTINFTP